MADMPARFTVKQGPEPDQEYTLSGEEITIGRSGQNDIVLNESQVSRQHARIAVIDGDYLLEDAGSTNGTYVNGQRVSRRVRLLDGDEVRFGERLLLVFHNPLAETQAGAARPAPQDADTVFVSVPAERDWAQAEAAETDWYAEARGEDAWRDDEDARDDEVVAERQTVQGRRPQVWTEPGAAEEAPRRSRRRRVLGCGCAVLLLVFLCAAALFFLDAYQQGRLLYCGPLRPLFELLLGPFGFSPVCG